MIFFSYLTNKSLLSKHILYYCFEPLQGGVYLNPFAFLLKHVLFSLKL
jgi:hypothetical protein